MDTVPTGQIAAAFSEPGATAVAWSAVEQVLVGAEMFFLSTVRKDGRPHVTPLPAIWFDGALHVCTGEGEQKSVNLRRDPRCVLSTSTGRMRDGLDVVLEGVAERVTAADRLTELAALWLARLDWPFSVVADGFDDGAHGVAWVLRVPPEKILAFGKTPFSQTRFVFPGGSTDRG